MARSPRLPLKTRVYEIMPTGNREQAIANVIADISAASRLSLPFVVETVNKQEFRNGGNVVKADIVQYVVSIGRFVDGDA